MAELPDLTVFAKILNHRFKGKTLQKVDVKVAKKLNVPIKKLQDALEGKKLEAVTREGKTLHLHFEDSVLRIHLMLRGELVLLEKDTEPKYEIVGFYFSKNDGFAVVDLQQIATLTLNPTPNNVPDALGDDMDFDYFRSLLAKKRTKIKTLLMDQDLIRGIGNSYTDEILWHAKISPLSIAKSIPPDAVKKLYDSLHVVLKTAIDKISEENGNELKGELRDFMKVHGSSIKKSPTGGTVKNEKIGGRMSYYTDEQELFS